MTSAAPDGPPTGAATLRGARAALSREMLAAAEAIVDLLDGRRLPDALSARTASLPAASRAPARDMAYLTVRRLGRLQALAARLNGRKPLPRVAALQLVALAQLLEPLRPEAIVVDQAVAAARSLSRGPGGSSAGFLNATLRRFLRERDVLLAQVLADPAARHDHPAWWLRRLADAWPQDWEAIAESGNVQAPLVLRVNRRVTDVDACEARLAAAGLATRRVGPEALVLERALPVEAIPGFAEGEVSVQDAGAQMAAHLLDLAPGQRVLDACAAPGGKTCHLLELADVEVLALDVDPARCARIEDNLARCRLPVAPAAVRVLAADAARPADWWDGRPFDRILVDAPCSASGIVRRHPDIRWLRRRGDIATLAAQQRQMLEALWPLLRTGGKLLYVTCSVFPDEGDAVVGRFVQTHPDCVRLPLDWAWPGGRREPVAQLLPRSGATREHDGFFYACLTKRQ
jgi:16S rRNA (cytosine967-C5)-methyltransferase